MFDFRSQCLPSNFLALVKFIGQFRKSELFYTGKDTCFWMKSVCAWAVVNVCLCSHMCPLGCVDRTRDSPAHPLVKWPFDCEEGLLIEKGKLIFLCFKHNTASYNGHSWGCLLPVSLCINGGKVIEGGALLQLLVLNPTFPLHTHAPHLPFQCSRTFSWCLRGQVGLKRCLHKQNGSFIRS